MWVQDSGCAGKKITAYANSADTDQTAPEESQPYKKGKLGKKNME